jgi:hypothetical protein
MCGHATCVRLTEISLSFVLCFATPPPQGPRLRFHLVAASGFMSDRPDCSHSRQHTTAARKTRTQAKEEKILWRNLQPRNKSQCVCVGGGGGGVWVGAGTAATMSRREDLSPSVYFDANRSCCPPGSLPALVDDHVSKVRLHSRLPSPPVSPSSLPPPLKLRPPAHLACAPRPRRYLCRAPWLLLAVMWVAFRASLWVTR